MPRVRSVSQPAIRNEADLLAILEPPPAAAHSPERVAEPALCRSITVIADVRVIPISRYWRRRTTFAAKAQCPG